MDSKSIKSHVVKSKSSNSAGVSKTAKRNHKKSKSNAEFPPYALKKRGVYVEKKATKMSLNTHGSSNLQKKQVKAPPRPRPGRKKFLASILTILSKSTTGTQYPCVNEDTGNIRKRGKAKETKAKTKKKIKGEPDEALPVREEGKVRNLRYRSKILNEEVSKFLEQQQLVILQSKKDIIQTPSNYSEKSNKEAVDNLKLSDLPALVKREQTEENNAIKNLLGKNIYTGMPDGLAREVLEGKKMKSKKKKKEEQEQSTLISVQDNNKKKEEGLYNFFVDLLETTFSVYNVKAEYNTTSQNVPSEVSTSRNALEIDESVAKKLNITKEERVPEMYDDITQKPSKRFHCIANDNNEEWHDRQIVDYFQSKPMSVKWSKPELPLKLPGKTHARKPKAKSITYNRNMYTSRIPSDTMTQNRSSHTHKKNKKKNLMCILKQQLQMEDNAIIEPQNLYQALKVMARNKRKYRKTIHFDEPRKGDTVCVFKRRKVISPITKFNKAKDEPEREWLNSRRYMPNNRSEMNTKSYDKSEYSMTTKSVSYHSLKVYGFDYENNPSRREKENKRKKIVYAENVSSDEYDGSGLRLSDSGSSITKYCCSNRKHGLRTISQLINE